MSKFTIIVYLENGLQSSLEEDNPKSAREISKYIIKNGYRLVEDGSATYYPPHKISKVQIIGNISNLDGLG